MSYVRPILWLISRAMRGRNRMPHRLDAYLLELPQVEAKPTLSYIIVVKQAPDVKGKDALRLDYSQKTALLLKKMTDRTTDFSELSNYMLYNEIQAELANLP